MVDQAGYIAFIRLLLEHDIIVRGGHGSLLIDIFIDVFGRCNLGRSIRLRVGELETSAAPTCLVRESCGQTIGSRAKS
jgi:hypothetical protein